MILIAQNGIYFSNIRYLLDSDYAVFDLTSLTISRLKTSTELQQFIASNKSNMPQEVYRTYEILTLHNLPFGTIVSLEHNQNNYKCNECEVDWVFDNTKQLDVGIKINKFKLNYQVVTHQDANGEYTMDFGFKNKMLAKGIAFEKLKPTETPLDKAELMISRVLDKDGYRIYTIYLDVIGNTFVTTIVETPKGVYFADIEADKFINIQDFSSIS